MADNQGDPEVERKARRAIVILYVVTGAGVTLPFILWWLTGRGR